MSSAPQGSAASSGLVVPPDVQQKFGAIIDLIRASESMNDEERQYWVNILPIMTPEQIKNLQDILDNERKQLAAIDAKYQKEIDHIGQAEMTKRISEERERRRTERTNTEANHKQQEIESA
jgi:hypothetical protein